MQTASILHLLDERFSAFGALAPHLNLDDTYFELADARMTVFRSDFHWAIFFELVQYDFQVAEYKLDIWAYGNGFTGAAPEGAQDLLIGVGKLIFELPQKMIIFDPATQLYMINSAGFSILRNGENLDFTPTRADYEAAGVVEPGEPVPQRLRSGQLLRFLCHSLDHPFFSSEDHLRFLIETYRADSSRSLSHQMRLFLQTRNWQHPNIIDEELPSDLEGFQVLARAIESGDLTEWEQLDANLFNSHWSCWIPQE